MKVAKFFTFFIVISLIISTKFLFAQDTEIKKSTVAAKVNSKEIFANEVDFFVQPELDRMRALDQKVTPELEKKLRNIWLDQAISRILLIEKAKADHFVVSAKEIDKVLQETEKESIDLTDDKLVKRTVMENIMVDKVIEDIMSKIIISEEEIKNRYNEKRDSYNEPEKVKARHILILEHATDPPEKKKENRKKIENILSEVKEGKTDFSELAKKYSEGPSLQSGGDLGYFSHGKMPPSFTAAAFALKPGEVSNVVETRFGYHIIKVEDRKPAMSVPFEEVRELIKENIRLEKGNIEIAKTIEELKSKATIEIFK